MEQNISNDDESEIEVEIREALWGLNKSGLGVAIGIDGLVDEMITRHRTYDIAILDEIFEDFRDLVRKDYPSNAEIDTVNRYLPDIEFLHRKLQDTANRIKTANSVRGLKKDFKRFLGLVGLKLQSYLLEIQAHVEWVVSRA